MTDHKRSKKIYEWAAQSYWLLSLKKEKTIPTVTLFKVNNDTRTKFGSTIWLNWDVLITDILMRKTPQMYKTAIADFLHITNKHEARQPWQCLMITHVDNVR